MRVNQKAEQDYAAMAMAYVKIAKRKLDPGEELRLPTIKPNTPEWIAWRRYFTEHLQFLPYIMQRVEDGFGSGEMTVPAEMPEQFDGSYTS